MAHFAMSSRIRGITLALMVSTALTATFAATPATGSTPPTAAFVLQSATQESSFTIGLDSTLTVHPDRTAEELTTTRIKILGEAALQSAGQQVRSFIQGMQTLEIVEAYTEKADGRKIPVDISSIITRDGANGVTMLYLDIKTSTIIFPDLAIGDTVVLTTRTNMKAGVYTGQFVNALPFVRTLPFADSTIRIVAPKSIGLQVAVEGEGLESQVAEDTTTITRTITYKPLPKRPSEPGVTSPLDRDPRILVSTFKSYEDMGRSYWTEAAPMAAVTPEVAALAEQITAGISDRRAQAEAISRWVKRNVRYVAVYLGAARVVPNPANIVLTRKYGDCKDHVTLMSALLSAKGIASEQVLIQAGDVYTLPDPPTMAYLNHVMLYLPEFKTYDDPTVSVSAFGSLSAGTYDKPVIHISANAVYVTRTPAMRPEDHTVINRTKINIAADGSMTGTTTEIGTGIFATGLRVTATQIQHLGLELSAEKQLRSLGWPGKGKFELGNPGELSPSYAIKSSFQLAYRAKAQPGATMAIPYGLSTRVRPGGFLLNQRYENRTLPFVCYSGRMIEETELTFAEGLPMPRPFRNASVSDRWMTYTADYKIEGRTLKIRREFMSHVPSQVCDPQVEKDIAQLMQRVRGSISTQIAFAPLPTTPVAQPTTPTPAPASYPPAAANPAPQRAPGVVTGRAESPRTILKPAS